MIFYARSYNAALMQFKSWKQLKGLLVNDDFNNLQSDIGTLGIRWGDGLVGLPEQLVLRADAEVRARAVDMAQSKACKVGTVGDTLNRNVLVGKLVGVAEEARKTAGAQVGTDIVVPSRGVAQVRRLFKQTNSRGGDVGAVALRNVKEAGVSHCAVEGEADSLCDLLGANKRGFARTNVEAGEILVVFAVVIGGVLDMCLDLEELRGGGCRSRGSNRCGQRSGCQSGSGEESSGVHLGYLGRKVDASEECKL